MPDLPIFTTRRLVLRGRTMADLDACLAMDRDPEVVRFIDGPWSDPAAHEAFVADRISRRYPPGLGYWTIRPRGRPGAFLGWILLIPADTEGPEVEIGWRLKRAAWGRGYATEAAEPVVAHAFRTVGLDRIVADIHPENAGSIGVARKLGMLPGRRGPSSFSLAREAFEALRRPATA